MANRIQLRRGTAAEWTADNPVLGQGEPGVETDTGKVKFGNGVAAWASLPYASQGPAGVADDGSVKDLITTPGSQTATALSATFVPTAFKRAVNLSILPGWADNTWVNNAVPFAQDQLWTYNGKQYAIWANDARKPIIGVRALPQGRWSTFDLSTVAGNPLLATSALRPHFLNVFGAVGAHRGSVNCHELLHRVRPAGGCEDVFIDVAALGSAVVHFAESLADADQVITDARSPQGWF